MIKNSKKGGIHIMTKRKIMLITVCFAIFAISLLLSRQFFKSAGKRIWMFRQRDLNR